jgi:hypothetical protein
MCNYGHPFRLDTEQHTAAVEKNQKDQKEQKNQKDQKDQKNQKEQRIEYVEQMLCSILRFMILHNC